MNEEKKLVVFTNFGTVYGPQFDKPAFAAVLDNSPVLKWERGSDEFVLCVPDEGSPRITRCLWMQVKDIEMLTGLLEELSENHAREEWREANGLPPLAEGKEQENG